MGLWQISTPPHKGFLETWEHRLKTQYIGLMLFGRKHVSIIKKRTHASKIDLDLQYRIILVSLMQEKKRLICIIEIHYELAFSIMKKTLKLCSTVDSINVLFHPSMLESSTQLSYLVQLLHTLSLCGFINR